MVNDSPENTTATAPAAGSGAGRWRTPGLVAVLVVVIVVVVSFLVHAGNDNSAASADSTPGATTTTTDPGSPSSSATSASTSDSTPPATVPSVAPGVDLDAALKPAFKAKFPALIPSEVPAGWTMISADWSNRLWTLSFTVPGGGTAELFQAQGSEKKLLKTNLPDAQSAGTVNLKKYGTGTWNAYQSAIGFGLTHAFGQTTALVMGADQDTVVTLAQQLLTAEDGQLTDDD